MFLLLVYGFGIVLILVAIAVILEGFESRDRGKIAGGAALGLGAAAGMHYLSKKNKEKKARKQLKA